MGLHNGCHQDHTMAYSALFEGMRLGLDLLIETWPGRVKSFQCNSCAAES